MSQPAGHRRPAHPVAAPAGRAHRHLPPLPRGPRRPATWRWAPTRARHHGRRHVVRTACARQRRLHPERVRLAGRHLVLGRADRGFYRPPDRLRRGRHHRRARPRRRGHVRRDRAPLLHARPASRHDRPRRRPVHLAVVRPPRRLVRRPPSAVVLLRRRHHRRERRAALRGPHTSLHEGGWTAHRLPDGRYLARHRDGRTLGPEPHPPGHNRPPPQPTPHRRQ